MACNFCNKEIYIKSIQYAKPLLAPLTRAEELRQQLQDITGEAYIQLVSEFCPVCGERKGVIYADERRN